MASRDQDYFRQRNLQIWATLKWIWHTCVCFLVLFFIFLWFCYFDGGQHLVYRPIWSIFHMQSALDCLILECFICTTMPSLNVIFSTRIYVDYINVMGLINDYTRNIVWSKNHRDILFTFYILQGDFAKCTRSRACSDATCLHW